MKPLCFVLMPFGKKPDEAGRVIDFDAIYTSIIAPALTSAGLDGIRADEEQVGGTIHKPMFERLLLCEYAIADLTTANPNVYYELGIRHALKPRSTVILFAHGTKLPFDVAPLRGLHYQLGEGGKPTEPDVAAASIAARLRAVRDDHSDDSPVFQLIEDMPRVQVDHQRADSFRERAAYSKSFKDRLTVARKQKNGAAEAVRAIAADPEFADLSNVETGIIVDLFLSFREVKAYAEMLALYEKMTPPLKRARMVQEQCAFALNRLCRHDEAAAILKGLIKDYGPNSETNGLLGRVYKDLRDAALAAGDPDLANGEHKRAIEAYLTGFEADWRDAFPGINALTLMELADKPDPRQADIAPVVRYSAMRKAKSPMADYWDHATLLEFAVLARDHDAAQDALQNARPLIEFPWMAETTMRNLSLIREKRASRGEDVSYISKIEAALQRSVPIAPPAKPSVG